MQRMKSEIRLSKERRKSSRGRVANMLASRITGTLHYWPPIIPESSLICSGKYFWNNLAFHHCCRLGKRAKYQTKAVKRKSAGQRVESGGASAAPWSSSGCLVVCLAAHKQQVNNNRSPLALVTPPNQRERLTAHLRKSPFSDLSLSVHPSPAFLFIYTPSPPLSPLH